MKPQRPFRGATKGKLFQTMDIGGGRYGFEIYSAARKKPHKNYAIIDPDFSFVLPKNARVFRAKALEAMDQAIREGWRTRHLRMFMPLIELEKPEYLKEMLKRARVLMLPGGKFLIGTNYDFANADNQHIFKEEGFILGKSRKLHRNEWSGDMVMMKKRFKEGGYEPEVQYYGIIATLSQKAVRQKARQNIPGTVST